MRRFLAIAVFFLSAITATAQTVALQPINFPVFRALDLNGQPLVGGQLFSYAAGTSTPLVTYTDSTGTQPNTNPVILDSTGSAKVFLGSAYYKFILKDQFGVTQWTVDNISGASAASSISLTPTGTQTVTQPAGTTLNVNNFNSNIYAQTGQNIGTLCTGFSGTVIVTIPLNVTTTTTLPASCGIEVKDGGSFNISSNQYLTIAGPFSAGLYQVFTGNGAIYFFGGNGPKEVYPQWFGAMGNAKAGGYFGTSGSTTVSTTGHNPWIAGDSVTLVGGGASGANLTTTIVSIAGGYPSTSAVISAPLQTTVSNSAPNPIYNVDDSVALNKWASSIRGNFVADFSNGYLFPNNYGTAILYAPKGQYNICTTPITTYNGTIWTSAAANITGPAVFLQCNPLISAIMISADNFDPAGNRIQQGNGNSTFNSLAITTSFPTAVANLPPAVGFYNASNNHSDTRFNDCLFEAVDGDAIRVGFQTTGSITAAQSILTVAQGLSLFNGLSVIVKGAGTAGADLTATISSGGGTNTLVLSIPAVTTVTNAIIYPTVDTYNLIIHHAELDVSQAGHFLAAQANATGIIMIDDSEIFLPFHGAIKFDTLRPMTLRWDNNYCFSCGNYVFPGADSFGIYIRDQSLSQLADVVIQNSQFNGTPGSITNATGGLSVTGVRTFKVSNNSFNQVDNMDVATKGIVSNGNLIVDIEGNSFNTTGLVAAAINPNYISLGGSPGAATAIIKNNSFYDSKLIGTISGSLTSGATSLTLTNAAPIVATQSIYIPGAGAGGGLYSGSVTTVVGSVVTFTPATGATVASPQIFSDFPRAISTVTAPQVADFTGNISNGNIIQTLDSAGYPFNFKTLVASFVSSGGTPQTIPLPGMTTGGHCVLTPTNNAAATVANPPYVTSKATDSVTIAYPNVGASMNFDLTCTSY